MKNEAIHPSFLDLERHALGVSKCNDMADHILKCTSCAEYVDNLKKVRAVPTWAIELADKKRFLRLPIYGRWALAAASVGVIAFASVTLVPSFSSHVEPTYSTTRGMPAVALYVNRQSRVVLWDGKSSISVGDKLRLKVVPEAYTYISVFSDEGTAGGPQDGLRLLYDAEIDEEREFLVPKAWEVTGDRDEEILIVALSRKPVSRAEVLAARKEVFASPELWLRTLRIPTVASR